MRKDRKKIRYARKPITSTCLLSKGKDSWMLKIINISASGMLVSQSPDSNNLHILQVDDICQVEIKLHKQTPLSFAVKVSRVSDEGYGLQFLETSVENQIPLWELLGADVDRVEK